MLMVSYNMCVTSGNKNAVKINSYSIKRFSKIYCGYLQNHAKQPKWIYWLRSHNQLVFARVQ